MANALACPMIVSRAEGHNPSAFSEGLLNGSWSVTLWISSKEMTYPYRRFDPVFPAHTHRWTSDPVLSWYEPTGYYNNETYASMILCQENIEICDSNTNTCQLGHPGWGNPRRILYNHKNFGHVNSSDDFARILLLGALADSSIIQSIGHDDSDFEAASHCRIYKCGVLERDQWIIEVRRWFEASLARIQFNVLDIARGTGNHGRDYEGIDPGYKGICQIVKFRSTGWRNVNVWGFLSLLGLVGATFVASVKTEEGNLWLMLGVRSLPQWWWTAYEVLQMIRSNLPLRSRFST